MLVCVNYWHTFSLFMIVQNKIEVVLKNKNTNFICLFFFVIFSLNFTILNAQIKINEIQASNDSTIADNFLEYDDWFELYNTTNSSINLAGYYLSDNIYYLTKFQIPNTNSVASTISANGYLLFWEDDNQNQGVNHCNFKLS